MKRVIKTMPMDGITIGAAVYELNLLLSGAKIDKIHQPEPDEVILLLRKNAANYRLLLSADCNNHARLQVAQTAKPNPAAPSNFCMLLRKHLTGGRIDEIRQLGNERIVHVSVLSANELGDLTPKTLILEIMGKYSNLILVNEEGTVLDALRRVTRDMSRERQVLPHDRYELPPSQGKAEPTEQNAVLLPAEGPVSARSVMACFTGFSRQAAEEVVFRAERCGNARAAFSDYMRRIHQRNYQPTLLTDSAGAPVDFLPFPYEGLDPDRQLPCASMSEAFDRYFTQRANAQHMRMRSNELRMMLERNLEKNEKRLGIYLQKAEECKDMDRCRIFGELLTANLYAIPRGSESATVPNYYSETGEPVQIPLDVRISLQANAQKYFKQFTKLKTAARLLEEQIAETRREHEYLESVLVAVENCTELGVLAEIREELVQQGYLRQRNASRKERPVQNAPLRFQAPDGTEIRVGRNNRQNDELTLKTAAKTDIWLHTKEIPGSHVVIRDADPSPEVLRFAAALAAFHSKARNSQNVPVDYTAVKNVKKPGGAKPGMVIYESYKTIYVNPEEVQQAVPR